jgi:hypothetical protein
MQSQIPVPLIPPSATKTTFHVLTKCDRAYLVAASRLEIVGGERVYRRRPFIVSEQSLLVQWSVRLEGSQRNLAYACERGADAEERASVEILRAIEEEERAIEEEERARIPSPLI